MIAKTIVEAQGGTLSLGSAEGEGTTVTMMIPAPASPTALPRPGRAKLRRVA